MTDVLGWTPEELLGTRMSDLWRPEAWAATEADRAGAGLDPAGAAALFGPRKPGSGAGSKIGLYVARAVAEAQGGRAWAEVRGGQLSFHLELPLPA